MGKTQFKNIAIQNLSKIKGSNVEIEENDSDEVQDFDDHIEKALARNKAQDIFKNI